jgi:hypothetical protein
VSPLISSRPHLATHSEPAAVETMSSTGPTAGESTLVGALLDVIHALPDVEQVAVLGQLRTITREGTDIDAQLKEMDGNEDIDEHLYRLRREVRKTALQAVWQRQLESWRSHIDTHLNTFGPRKNWHSKIRSDPNRPRPAWLPGPSEPTRV